MDHDDDVWGASARGCVNLFKNVKSVWMYTVADARDLVYSNLLNFIVFAFLTAICKCVLWKTNDTRIKFTSSKCMETVAWLVRPKFCFLLTFWRELLQA